MSVVSFQVRIRSIMLTVVSVTTIGALAFFWTPWALLLGLAYYIGGLDAFWFEAERRAAEKERS